MTPKSELSKKPPAELAKRKIASETWKRTVGLYAEVEGKIATSFDRDLLVKYCLLEEEVIELAKMRDLINKEWSEQLKVAKRFKPNAEQVKDYVKMWGIVNGLFARYQGIDARLDGKRKLLHSLSQSLYLTPRSRAGVAPPTKPAEEKPSGMEKILRGE
jgi:phage terminase small subunit